MDISKVLIVLAALCFKSVFSSGELFRFGGCPNVQPMEDFQIQWFLGKWYDQYGFFDLWNSGNKCTTFTLIPNINKGSMRVLIKNVDWLGIPNSREAELLEPRDIVNSRDLGKWRLQFPFWFPKDFWIVATDYDNYAIAWSCQDFFFFHLKTIWVKTRTRHVDPQKLIRIQKNVNRFLDLVDVGSGHLFSVGNDDCNHPSVQ